MQERAQLQEDMERLTKEIEKAEQDKQAARVRYVKTTCTQIICIILIHINKYSMSIRFVTDLDEQAREKEARKSKEERFRANNELASKLAEFDLNQEATGITV